MHRGWSRHEPTVAVFLIFLLGGCAGSTPMLSPAEYPFHAEAPQVEIHWQLTVEPSRVQADGVIERQRETQIREAWLQLLGDGARRIVSFTAAIRVPWRLPGTLVPFTIALIPRGGEQRYEVRVYSIEYSPQLQQRT